MSLAHSEWLTTSTDHMGHVERRAFLEKMADPEKNLFWLKERTLRKSAEGPTDIQTFVEDRDYLDMKHETYPEIMKELVRINSGKYIELVCTGAIGTAKTTLALVTNAYQLYRLSQYTDPQQLYGLASSSELLFIFQNISAQLAKTVDFDRFKAMLERSKYFVETFPFDKNILSEL